MVLLAKGPGDPPAFRLWNGKTVRFVSTTVQEPDRPLVGGPNPAPYPSIRGSRRGWLDLSAAFSGFAFQVVLVMVAFRYLNVNCIILTMVCQCSLWMNRPPLCSKYVVKRSLPHPENERQWSINNFRSCTLGNQSGYWLQLVITEIMASFICKHRSNTLPAPLSK